MACDRSMVTITPWGGPTALVEWAGRRFLTDPTLDSPGEYPGGAVTLRKLTGPRTPDRPWAPLDAALLSHDQHADNLDHGGRRLVAEAPLTLTTPAGARRLGSATGLAPGQTYTLGTTRVTATPARHGPPGIEAFVGDVTGFLIEDGQGPGRIYITGDTVFYDGVAEVVRRHRPSLILAFAGGAKTRGPFHLTMSVDDVLNLSAAAPDAKILPLHTEGWSHFTQTIDDLVQAFRFFGIEPRLVVAAPGQRVEVDLGSA